MSETSDPAFEKEVVRLPDGRRLIYYRFPNEAPGPSGPRTPRPDPAPSSPPSEEPGSQGG